MFFKCFTNGMVESNCYIVGDNNEGIIIDAGVEASYIEKVLADNDIKVNTIILTHCHIDHIFYINELVKICSAKVYIHIDDYEAFNDNDKNLANAVGVNFISYPDVELLKDGDKIKVSGLEFEIIHTPGHTKGSICIKCRDMLFTGDTLFKNSVGRTDFEDGSFGEIKNSIVDKLYSLDGDMIVYPGHGSSTMIKMERNNNPFVRLVD